MTVVIDTPQGERSGSSVMEVSVLRIPALTMESHSLQTRLRGEAVAVDIPGAPTLFALTGNANDLAQTATRLFDPSVNPGPDSVLPTMAKLGRADQRGRQVVMPEDKYPQLVRFTNILIPRSVEEVDPSNLADSYGPVFALNRIILTLTNEPVTKGIKNRFPWWDRHINRHFDETSTSSETRINLIAYLSSASFSTEVYR